MYEQFKTTDVIIIIIILIAFSKPFCNWSKTSGRLALALDSNKNFLLLDSDIAGR